MERRRRPLSHREAELSERQNPKPREAGGTALTFGALGLLQDPPVHLLLLTLQQQVFPLQLLHPLRSESGVSGPEKTWFWYPVKPAHLRQAQLLAAVLLFQPLLLGVDLLQLLAQLFQLVLQGHQLAPVSLPDLLQLLLQLVDLGAQADVGRQQLLVLRL